LFPAVVACHSQKEREKDAVASLGLTYILHQHRWRLPVPSSQVAQSPREGIKKHLAT